ncbi:DUF58 domain-containing protein, partial [Micromonospora sp. CPCC 205714]
ADTEIRARVAGSGRPALLARLVDAVAPLQPALAETDFELIAAEVLRRERQRSLVVLFTALEAGAIGDGLLPVLPRLATRHRVVLAAAGDPVLNRLATATPAGPDDPYAAASAWRALAERDRVRAALSRYGVTVVDVPGHRLAPAVADTYLRLKSLGQL